MTTSAQRWPAMAIRFLFRERAVISVLVAAAAGVALERWRPFPQPNPVLGLIALRTPGVYEGLRFSYTLFLFTTPLIAASLALSTGYIFFYRPASGEITQCCRLIPTTRALPSRCW
ncbi:MAG: hypothetical protein ACRD2E_01600 [Terriglobales bacterium]